MFMQISSSMVNEDSVLQQASVMLNRAAAATGDPKLALIAASVRPGMFDQVVKAMKQLKTDLEAKKKNEKKRHDTCNTNIKDNEDTTEDTKDKKTTLDSGIASLEQKLKTTKSEINELKATIAETKKQMKRNSEMREQENGNAQKSIMDHRLAQDVLIKAMVRMRQVYALLEEPSKHEGGNKIVGMLDNIIKASRSTEEEVATVENKAQTAYEQFFKNSNDLLLDSGKSVTTKVEQKTKSEKALASKKRDLSETETAIESLADESKDLHEDCDFLIKNFDVRQEAVQAEIDALKEVLDSNKAWVSKE